MKATSFLRILAAASCLALASCSGLWPYENSAEAGQRSGSGYSLDNPAAGQSRYMAGPDGSTAVPGTPGAPVDPNAVAGPTSPVDPNAPIGTTTTPDTTASTPPAPTTPVVTPTTPPPPPAASTTPPAYGTPVPGRRGFVYPPGAEAKPENMVDVRDFTPGQKVRDPRTQKIFLVP